MKKVTRIILTIATVAFLISCGDITRKKQGESKIQKTEEVEHESESVLQLNNGNLWNANTETTTGINNMISLMNSFPEKENIEAYATLKLNLETEFGTIITECTMQGEPHNQLHNYLIPMKEAFDGIGSNDIATCKKNFETLNKHLATYANFFE